jgi:hypothetical protein
MTLDEAISRMFCCATAERCAREEACFVVVKWARDRRTQERLAEEMARAANAPVDSDGVVTDYAPQWEANCCGIPIDWDAA